MRKGFIKHVSSATELQEIIVIFANAGIAIDEITIDSDFDGFVNSSVRGDVIVVQSYALIFGSLIGFLNKSLALLERGIRIESLSEPELRIDSDTIDIMRSLNRLGHDIYVNRTRKGLVKAKSEGRALGRPVGTTKVANKVARIDKLRESQNLTVAQACEKVGCLPRTYYRHRDKKS